MANLKRTTPEPLQAWLGMLAGKAQQVVVSKLEFAHAKAFSFNNLKLGHTRRPSWQAQLGPLARRSQHLCHGKREAQPIGSQKVPMLALGSVGDLLTDRRKQVEGAVDLTVESIRGATTSNFTNGCLF